MVLYLHSALLKPQTHLLFLLLLHPLLSTIASRSSETQKPRFLPVLEQWVTEGGAVEKQELQSLVRLLKDFRRFNHALEISQWMTDRRYFDLSPSDAAARLNLIHRVHGLEDAENIYVQENSVEKAEATMQKMKKLGMAKTSFPYNMLINLYSQNGEHEKINILMQEMEENGIPLDKYTLRNRMIAYIAASDMPGMETILNRMEEDSNFIVDWKIYSMAASGYLKVGMIKKACSMLKMMERMMPLQGRKSLEFLITLYANTGHKGELYRVWNTYKQSNEPMDVPYGCMISSLAKLDDIEGAERIFEEWESQCTEYYDFRVLNRLLVAYCKKGLFDKAESAVKKAAEGRIPYASTWNALAMGYTESKQMPKAIETLKKALSVDRWGWVPDSSTLTACLDYLEGQGDFEGIEEIISLLKNLGPLSRDLYHRLLRASAASGKSVSIILDQMKVDGFTADEEAYKFLETGPS
ncbi:unnamed protein product [Prunus armeniaca]|uniref:Pentacotripeptide-repeat region of PRORP domain-containing protein n=1 Tax=Prunus armeniaca TaxID=36596 RepID=A0A6J5UAK1_PRUAR|nr:unnamed protein product [Prunus armeniaca]